MNLNINDPAIPAPGEMQMSPGSPGRLLSSTWPATSSHGRQPSLGELHQELENEQEAQVVSVFVLLISEKYPSWQSCFASQKNFFLCGRRSYTIANRCSLRIAYLP